MNVPWTTRGVDRVRVTLHGARALELELPGGCVPAEAKPRCTPRCAPPLVLRGDGVPEPDVCVRILTSRAEELKDAIDAHVRKASEMMSRSVRMANQHAGWDTSEIESSV